MRQVSELILDELAPRVEAAVAWFNSSPESAGETFTVTGILDPDAMLLATLIASNVHCRIFRRNPQPNHRKTSIGY
jgi:hypothetical protein